MIKMIKPNVYCIVLLAVLASKSAVAFADRNQNKDASDKAAQETTAPETIIRELIEANRLDEAWTLLENIEGNDAGILCFKGIISLKREQPQKAVEYFMRAGKIEPLSPGMHLFAAKAYYNLGNLEETLKSLEAGFEAGKNAATYYLFSAQVQKSLGRHEQAYETLQQGERRFPAEKKFLRDKALLFVKLGLFASSLDPIKTYIREENLDINGCLAAAHAYQKARRFKEAASILEEARLKLGETPLILSRLGFVYGEMERHFAAARFLERATTLGGDFAFDSAEHYAVAGGFEKALKMNSLVKDKKARLSQRLSLYIKQKKLDRARIIGEQMKKEGLMKEDRDRYCLVYAYAELGLLDKAKKIFKEIKDPAWKKTASSYLD